MDFLAELVTAALGIVIGYLLKRPEAKELIERVKVERVEVPVIVREPELRIERVEVPVIVEKPTLQVERIDVPVPHVVEKPVVQKVEVERVIGPVSLPSLRIGKPKGTPVQIKLKSGSLKRDLGTYECDDNQRKPTIAVRCDDGTLGNFVASHQDPDGQWVYRRVGVERA